MKKFTTVGDAAHRSGYSPDRIRQLIDQGIIKAEKTPTGVRLPYVEDVERFIQERGGIKLSERNPKSDE